MIFLYGTRSVHIGTTDVTATCLTCNTTGPHTLSLFSRHAHLFWIPLFPVGKLGVARCQHCMATHDDRSMPTQLRQMYQQTKANVPAPVWQWAGLGIGGLFVLFIIGMGVFYPESAVSKKASAQFKQVNSPVDYQQSMDVKAVSDEVGFTPAPPDEARHDLIENPEVGDQYTTIVARKMLEELPGLRVTMTVVAVSADTTRMRVINTVTSKAGKDSLINDYEVPYAKSTLLLLDKSGVIGTVIRN